MPTLPQKVTKRASIIKMKSVPEKKKKPATDTNKPPKDTIAETISFVIKGKITPIKTTYVGKHSDSEKAQKPKNTKQQKNEKTPINKPKKAKDKIPKKEIVKLPAVPSKVQTKTAKKPTSATKPQQKSNIKNSTKVPKQGTSPKLQTTSKTIKKAKTFIKPKPLSSLVNVKKQVTKCKPTKKSVPSESATSVTVKQEELSDSDRSTEETIQKLLAEASNAIKPKPSNKKKKNAKQSQDKSKMDPDKKLLKTKSSSKKSSVKPKAEPEKTEDMFSDTSDEISLKDLRANVEKSKKESASNESKKVVKKEVKKPVVTKRKIKPTPSKMVLIKKRVPIKQDKSDNQKTPRKSKLFGFWSGPKRHRVASLNALAKVHCLYENESRANLLDGLEASYKSSKSSSIKKESDDEDKKEVVSTRTLRSVPGLRAVGKHWDMHDTTSSSDESSSSESNTEEPPPAPKPKPKREYTKKSTTQKESDKPPKKRRRNHAELIMDLKDMVVRKRMASLNASAILAASYSVEKRASRGSGDSSDTDSSDDYFMTSDSDVEPKVKEVKNEEEDRKVIEVHTTPSKKVAVILNQDTDVTITGVYVNSTTRSTHQDGYCSIAGMQYRISATSHTQTAATAVATETLLQSSSCAGPESINSDSTSSKSYTPLDALSSMQPPPGPGIQHGHVLHGQHQPHIPLPIPPHQLSPGRRHGCASAFSSPHANQTYPPPGTHHHHLAMPPPPPQADLGYVHGIYQPAGPLISPLMTVPHGHGQPQQQAPQPSLKNQPQPKSSPTSSTPPASQPPPAPASSNGDSSDSEVIITSVTTSKEAAAAAAAASQAQQPPPSVYRCSQYPPNVPPGLSYSLPPPSYHYSTPPPPPPTSSYGHHDLCYPPPYMQHKYHPTYRRYITGPPYYSANPQEMYPLPPTGPSQQLVTASPVQASGTAYQAVPNGPPPPTLIEGYPPPPPTLVESYQPPPHCYSAYGPPPSCYTHSSTRPIPYMNTTYQGCPCPMQSCPKNVLTGPLTGKDSKRSNIPSIIKDVMPLPPVALALPLEPASATGPPSPARGSAGMPPPPSPAGATYQPPPPPVPKQESQSPEIDTKTEIKRKARIGKENVRNTMLLMSTQNYISTVKREIESPKEKDLEQKKELICETACEKPSEIIRLCETKELKEETILEKDNNSKLAPIELEPCVLTVAENVKVKNMKRKMSTTQDKPPEPITTSPSPNKKAKIGSYKDFIKKDTSTVKINSGKRKLIQDQAKARLAANKFKVKRPALKRKLNGSKQEPKSTTKKRPKNSKPSPVQKVKKPVKTPTISKSAPQLLDNLIAKNSIDRTIESVVNKAKQRALSLSSSSNASITSSSSTLTSSPLLHPTETVDSRCPDHGVPVSVKESSALIKTVNKCVKGVRETIHSRRKSTNNRKNNNTNNNNNNIIELPLKGKVVVECKKTTTARRKSKCKEVVAQAVSKVPRRSLPLPRWSNGWTWEGESFEGKVFLNSDETVVTRRCYSAMRHSEGDVIEPRDCVLLKAGLKKNELPFVAKIAALWENPDDGEMMMSLLWYYRPEHTEQGRLPTDQPDEVFASRHKDSNSVACIDDKCYVLTFNEYCRYRKNFKRLEEGIEQAEPCIPIPEPYPRNHRQPPSPLQISPEMVFFCRRVYDFRQKRIVKNPT